MVTWLDDGRPLPPPQAALGPDSDAPGLVAAGGRVTPERLFEAYRQGIFPWYSAGQPVLWWSPDPRMVLHTAEFRLSHSLRKTLRRFRRTPGCELRFSSEVPGVLRACALTPREGQDGTWLLPEMAGAYLEWHRQGHVQSVETWMADKLVGGLYFVNIGRMCFGESMFAHRTDASKIALAGLVAACRARGITLIDCQQNTGHLASLGAREIPREDFLRHVAQATAEPQPAEWSYDDSAWDGLALSRPPLTATPQTPDDLPR